MKKRIIWALAGVIWAVAHGFITMFMTVYWPGNFFWVFAFFFGYIFGLLIPVIAFVTADTKQFWAKIAGWSLIAVALALTILSIDSQGPDMRSYIADFWGGSLVLFILMSILHCVPIAFFVGRLVRGNSIHRKA